jgi:hypothetical protein
MEHSERGRLPQDFAFGLVELPWIRGTSPGWVSTAANRQRSPSPCEALLGLHFRSPWTSGEEDQTGEPR